MRGTLPALVTGAVIALGTFGCGGRHRGSDNNNHVVARCGNSIAESAETCDGTDLRGSDCTTIDMGYTGGTLACLEDCTAWDISRCVTLPDCGNSRLDTGETCDGTDLGGNDCATIGMGFTGGTLACIPDCSDWDHSGCISMPDCGNDQIDGDERCDGADLGGNDCTTIGMGFTGGTLGCHVECTDWDTSGCVAFPHCGNGLVDPGESCDGTNLGGNTCATVGQGFTGGTLACLVHCGGFETSGCTTLPGCGNRQVDAGETCDGTDLGGNDCTSIGMGYTGGTLTCLADCTGWNTAGCIGGRCGDGIVDQGEQCDDTNLGGLTCAEFNCTAGSLACNANCTLDTAGCTGCSPCGNGVIDAGEVCDGPDLAGQTCADHGYGGGSLFCDGTCGGLVTGGCFSTNAACGNNVIEPTESCDSSKLKGSTCFSFGFSGGTLACGSTCGFDVSGCTGDVCQNRGWYNDGICDLCQLMGGQPDTDCRLCGNADGNCPSVRDPIVMTSTCLFAAGAEDPDCGGGCGNGHVDMGSLGALEWCDGADLRSTTCANLGFIGGTLACNADCNFDTSGCWGVAAVCGDDRAQGAEWCDGTDLRGNNCTTIAMGFNSGTLACNATCNGWDVSGCAFVCPAIDLGTWNGTPIHTSGDTCTGARRYNPGTCTGYPADGYELVYSLTLANGATVDITYAADTDNSLYVITDCVDTAGTTCVAGADDNWTIPYQEQVTLTNTTGSQATFYIVTDNYFSTDCGAFTLDIKPPPVCGDDLAAPPEVCDGTDLQGNDCTTIAMGFSGGTLACNASCDGWMVAACTGGGTALEGEPCTLDSDCAYGNCLDESGWGFPGGHCAQDCTLWPCVGSGTTCVDFGGIFYCLKGCAIQAHCRPGYGCWDFSTSEVVCYPDCDDDSQCPVIGCNEYSGFCTPDYGLGRDGAPCLTGSDCEGQYCLDEAGNGFPGGYCISTCTKDLDNCPGDGVCTDVFTNTRIGGCLDGCAAHTECRMGEGYTCQVDPIGNSGLDVCWP